MARVLGLPLAAVRVEQAPTGGGFGGKEDYPSEPAACAALLAWRTGRPVRLLYHRELDLQVTTKRHAAVVRHRWGADAKGKLCFAEVETIMDAGGYVGLSTVVAERANVSAIGPYDVPVVDVKTHVVYTNNLFGGAYRGFGAPQVTWAAEATLDKLARAARARPPGDPAPQRPGRPQAGAVHGPEAAGAGARRGGARTGHGARRVGGIQGGAAQPLTITCGAALASRSSCTAAACTGAGRGSTAPRRW